METHQNFPGPPVMQSGPQVPGGHPGQPRPPPAPPSHNELLVVGAPGGPRPGGDNVPPGHPPPAPLQEVAMLPPRPAPSTVITPKLVPSHHPTLAALSGGVGVGPVDSSGFDRRSLSETIFPMKLYEILANPDFREAISWMPHGRSWKVLQKDKFMAHICPQYFAQTRYESFVRQVNGWGFKRMRREGPDRGSYYHDHFIMGCPHAIDKMRRPAPGEKSRDLREEPEFHLFPPMPPLPAQVQREAQERARANAAASHTSHTTAALLGLPHSRKVGRPTGSFAPGPGQGQGQGQGQVQPTDGLMMGLLPKIQQEPAVAAQQPPPSPVMQHTSSPYHPYHQVPHPYAWNPGAPPPGWPQGAPIPPQVPAPYSQGYPPPGYFPPSAHPQNPWGAHPQAQRPPHQPPGYPPAPPPGYGMPPGAFPPSYPQAPSGPGAPPGFQPNAAPNMGFPPVWGGGGDSHEQAQYYAFVHQQQQAQQQQAQQQQQANAMTAQQHQYQQQQQQAQFAVQQQHELVAKAAARSEAKQQQLHAAIHFASEAAIKAAHEDEDVGATLELQDVARSEESTAAMATAAIAAASAVARGGGTSMTQHTRQISGDVKTDPGTNNEQKKRPIKQEEGPSAPRIGQAAASVSPMEPSQPAKKRRFSQAHEDDAGHNHEVAAANGRKEAGTPLGQPDFEGQAQAPFSPIQQQTGQPKTMGGHDQQGLPSGHPARPTP